MSDNLQIESISNKSSICLWAQAGVVGRKECNQDYNCVKCRFDRVMMEIVNESPKLKEAGFMSWRDKMKSMPLKKRACIHHMKGQIEFRLCTNEYRCGRCEFDQYFGDLYSVHAEINPVKVLNVSGFTVPQGYYLDKGHTWIKLEEDCSIRIGIDDFIHRVLGPFDRIEVPLMGKRIVRNDRSIILRRGDCAAAVPCPVSGIVTEVNPALRESGGPAGKSPYVKGWIMKVHAERLREDIKYFFINRESCEFIREQSRILSDIIKSAPGLLLAERDSFDDRLFIEISKKSWKELADLFIND